MNNSNKNTIVTKQCKTHVKMALLNNCILYEDTLDWQKGFKNIITMKRHQGNHCSKATPHCDDGMLRGGVNNVLLFSQTTNTSPK